MKGIPSSAEGALLESRWNAFASGSSAGALLESRWTSGSIAGIEAPSCAATVRERSCAGRGFLCSHGAGALLGFLAP